MPVIDHAKAAKPEGYQSNNHNKWEYDNKLYQKHLELYLDHMYNFLRQTAAKKILDVGCGEGIVYRAMKERGFIGEWTGFDYSQEAVDFASKASPEANWKQGSAYEIPYADNEFDLCFCSQVLEHLPNPQQPLAEIARVTKKWMLISVPLEPRFRVLTWISVNLKIGGDPGHVNHWTGGNFRKFISTVGNLHTWDWTTIYQIALAEKK